MPETNNRNIRILGAAWLALGGLALVYVIINLFSLAQGNAPSATEVSDGYWVFFVGALVIGIAGMANGFSLLLRNPVARPLLAVSSLLLLPTAFAIVPLLVVAPSLWLALSGDGKKALESYIAREGG